MPLQLLSELRSERVPWLWPGRVPFGMTTLVDGDPGVGKTVMVLDLIARLTTGRALPVAGQNDPLAAVYMTIENSGSQVLRPRLENAGADMSKIALLTTYTDEEGNEVLPSLPDDLPVIERAILTMGARVVVIDPIMTYLGDAVNSNNTHQVYRALAPLNDLAERTGAAIILLRHLNKDRSGPALYRGQGAIGFVAAVRSAMVVAPAPDVSDVLIVANYKANLAPPVPAISFTLHNCENGAPRAEWGGVADYSADTLLAAPASERERPALDEASDFLRELLQHGPVLSREVWRQANAAGLNRQTLFRAKELLGVKAVKEHRQDGGWSWQMPDHGGDGEESDEGAVPDASYSSYRSYSSDSSHEKEKSMKSSKNMNSRGNGDTELFGAPHVAKPSGGGVPVASASGYGNCARCGRRTMLVKGLPALCHECEAASGLKVTAD